MLWDSHSGSVVAGMASARHKGSQSCVTPSPAAGCSSGSVWELFELFELFVLLLRPQFPHLGSAGLSVTSFPPGQEDEVGRFANP